MTYEEHIDYIINHTKQCIEAYTLFCEYRFSLRKCAKEMMISHTQVKNLLENLANINDDYYQEYKREQRRRRK